jgi:hypothetical protein
MPLADENAEFLASIAARGTDLSIPQTIDFAHLLYSEFSAAQFKRAAENKGYRVQLKLFPPFEVEERKAWDAVASAEMVPSVEEITRCESELAALARRFGGHSDGWAFQCS